MFVCDMLRGCMTEYVSVFTIGYLGIEMYDCWPVRAFASLLELSICVVLAIRVFMATCCL